MNPVLTRRGLGFTLIELMVTVALAAVLAFVAVPSLTIFKRNAELTSVTNALVAALSTARSEALKRGYSGYVTPSNGTNWNGGWVSFVNVSDDNTSRTFEAATDVLLNTQAPLPSYFSVTGPCTTGSASGTSFVRFDASGFAGMSSCNGIRNANFLIERNDLPANSPERLEQSRRVIISITGRVRACKPSAGDASCSSNSL